MRQADQTRSTTPSAIGGAFGAQFSMNGELGASLVAIALAGIMVLSGFFSVVTSAFGRGIGNVQPADKLKELIAKHEQEIQMWEKRFDNRSVFFKPQAPRPKEEEVKDAGPVPPPPPPHPPAKPPDSYQGPPILFACADVIYFGSGSDKALRIPVGEEESDVKVISTDLPWSVKIGNKGGIYDVPVFGNGEHFLERTPLQGDVR